MKLNPDCIRDILLTVEEHTDMTKQLLYPVEDVKYERLESYSQDEVFYHVKQCELSGFVTKVNWFGGGGLGCRVYYLSPSGHEFLANIRNDSNWSKTKEVAKSVGSFSLSTLKDIASSVIASVISAQLNK